MKLGSKVIAAVALSLTAQSALAATPTTTAGADPRATTAGVTSPNSALVVEAGTKEQRLTGRVAYAFKNGAAVDLSLTGANQDKTSGRSDLLHLAAGKAGGELALGFIYTSIHVDPRYDGVLDTLCKEQMAEKAKPDAKGEPTTIKDAQENATKKREERDAKKKALGKAEEDFLKAVAAAKTAPTDAAEAARQAVALAGYDLERARIELRNAEDAVKTAETRENELLNNQCSEETLTPARRAQLPGWSPAWLLFARGSVGTKSIDYFDTSTGTAGSEVVHPLGIAAGLGFMPAPNLLLGTSLRYARDKASGNSVSLCSNQAVAGATATPPTYACVDRTLGVPAARFTTTVRFELRYVFESVVGLGVNPSLNYTYVSTDSKDDFPIFRKPGVWMFDLPFFFRLGDKSPLTFGAAYQRRETFGLGDKNERSNDVIAFVSAAFTPTGFATSK